VTEDPGSGQSPRGNNRPVEPEEPTSSSGSPSQYDATSPTHDIDAALTTLRAVDAPSEDAGNPWLEGLDLRSPDPRVCPFLRALDDTDQLAAPIGAPDALNRCAALREAIPQSLRQQELVCLTSGHVNCPRYLRGAMVAEATPRRAAMTLNSVRRLALPRPSLSPAIFAATLVLIAAFAGSVAFVVARGGLAMPVAAIERPSPSPSALAIAPPPEPDPQPHAVADTDTDADADAQADRQAGGGPDSRPFPRAAPLPEPLELLHLHRRARKQPVQHRALLPRVIRPRAADEPVDHRPGEHPRRGRGPHADSSASVALTGGGPVRPWPLAAATHS
jgi:hypothetical protein